MTASPPDSASSSALNPGQRMSWKQQAIAPDKPAIETGMMRSSSASGTSGSVVLSWRHDVCTMMQEARRSTTKRGQAPRSFFD